MEPCTSTLLCFGTQGSALAHSRASPWEKEHAYAAGCRADCVLGDIVYPGDGDFLALPRRTTAQRAVVTDVPLTLREGQTILGVMETRESMCFCIGKSEEHVHDEEDTI